MKKWLTVMVCILGLVALLVGGCAKEAGATGIVEVRVTDAPPDGVDSFVIHTDEVRIHKEDAEEEDGWIEVFKAEESVDLLDVMGIEEVLGNGEVEAGRYNGLRMHVTGVEVTLKDEDTIRQATVPSEWLKVVGNFEVKSGGEVTVLTVDFDAAKSVVITKVGTEQSVKFKPTVKLLVRGANELGKPSLLLRITQPEEDETTVNTAEIEVSGVTEPDAMVSIDGEPVDVDAEGNFSTMVTLQEGLNSIEVVASDSEGNQNSKTLTITYAP